jgi:hypothetical protein
MFSMTLRRSLALLCCLCAAAPIAMAQRDFLTPDEVNKVREVQEPDLRLALYTTFAQLRMEMLRNYFADTKPGRSALIHDALEDYTKIIEAIDTVADDALRRNLTIDKGIEAVEKAERAMLADLERFDEMEAADRSRYSFVLEDAIEATRDSLSLAEEDVRDRKVDVITREAAEQKKREEMMTTEEVKERRDQEKKEAKDKQGRKLPSLRRPEEAVAAPPASKKK